MSLEDSNYSMLYYCAITIDPKVERIIRLLFARRILKNEDIKIETKPDRAHLPFKYYGYRTKDYRLWICPVLNEFITKGVIK